MEDIPSGSSKYFCPPSIGEDTNTDCKKTCENGQYSQPPSHTPDEIQDSYSSDHEDRSCNDCDNGGYPYDVAFWKVMHTAAFFLLRCERTPLAFYTPTSMARLDRLT